MRRIGRAHAHPGDLVFHLRGGSAYHVAIYAAHGYQYSATDPQQGARYQRIHSRHVVFGTG
jgi:cell wall-associated NlpC family hydrolase